MTIEWITSAENTAYQGWQAMLFHYSVYAHTGRAPITAVMANDDEPLREEFEIIKRMGGRVQRCGNYRHSGYTEHAGRNTPGAMIEVKSDAEWVVVCDVDMLLTRDPRTPPLFRGQVTVDSWASYLMFPEHASVAGVIDLALTRAGIHRETFMRHRVWGGVPHMMRGDVMSALGHEWLGSSEVFLPQFEGDPTPLKWDVPLMWGLMLATTRLGLDRVRTGFCETNSYGTYPWDPYYSMIHYGWGEKEEFSKVGRDTFPTEELTATPGSINEQVILQIKAAREWYAPMTTKIGVAVA